MKRKITLTSTFVKRIDLVMTGKSIPSNLQGRANILAELCTVTSQAARKWLTGKSIPGYEHMMLIASKFSVTTSYLIGEIDIATIGKSDESSILKNNTKRGVITIEITEDMFSGELMAGDTVICHPCKTIINNGEIYLLQSSSQRFFRQLSFTENRDLIIEYQENGENIKNTYTDKEMIDLFLSSLVGQVEAVLRKVRFSVENSTK